MKDKKQIKIESLFPKGVAKPLYLVKKIDFKSKYESSSINNVLIEKYLFYLKKNNIILLFKRNRRKFNNLENELKIIVKKMKIKRKYYLENLINERALNKKLKKKNNRNNIFSIDKRKKIEIKINLPLIKSNRFKKKHLGFIEKRKKIVLKDKKKNKRKNNLILKKTEKTSFVKETTFTDYNLLSNIINEKLKKNKNLIDNYEEEYSKILVN